jgi:AraC-like DNA-binding protein
MVCVKNGSGRYVLANEAFVRRTGRRSAEDVLGRCAADLFPVQLAAAYDAQDRSVLLTGRAVRNRLELIPGRDGRLGWYLTTKVVDRSERQRPLVVVVSVPAHLGGDEEAAALRRVIEYVRDHAAEPLRTRQLTEVAGMSQDRLERSMRRALGTSPKQYVLSTRAELAAHLLVTTGEPLAAVAAAAGYYDQSQFTRQFRQQTGLSPQHYRRAAQTSLV